MKNKPQDRRSVKKGLDEIHEGFACDVDFQDWVADATNRFIELPADYVLERKREIEAIVRDAVQSMGIHAAMPIQRGIIASAILNYDGGGSPAKPKVNKPEDFVTG